MSSDPYQLQSTLGLQWSPNDRLDVSLVGLLGVPPGSDRYGVLFGVAYKLQLWD